MDKAFFEKVFAALPAAFHEKAPVATLVLGSGWNKATESLREIASVDYADLPGVGGATVIGHSGRITLAETPDGGRVAGFCGRRHWYEGCDWEPVVMPAVLCKMLGAPVLLLTNAAGGIRNEYDPGDVIIISDHLRLSPLSPLRGGHDPFFGPRFPDQSEVYDRELRGVLLETLRGMKLALREGVYAFTSGPLYETPAEVRAYAAMGADLVGMSTVPEAIVANAMGVRVAAVSFVSNSAAGVSSGRLDGEEVVACANANAHRLASVVLGFLKKLPHS